MKILHTVEFYHPSVGGMQEVVRQLSERLVKLGHEVTVATTRLPHRNENPINGVRIAEFSISGNAANGLSGETGAYLNFLNTSDFDIITNFAAQQWATDTILPFLDQIKAKKVFVPTGFSGLYLPQYKEYFELMKSWLKKYDINIFLSNDYRDINFARDCGVNNMVLIPNGAGKDEFWPKPDIDIRQILGIPQHDFLILHVGSHTGIKGHSEALAVFEQAGIPEATFLLVANNFDGGGCAAQCMSRAQTYNNSAAASSLNKKIIVTELPRRETVTAYHAADAFLFPSNIECSPLVLFEAMASKTPFLTSDVGNSAEIIGWSGGGLLLPTLKDNRGYCTVLTSESAKILEDLYHNPAQRTAMGESGYQAWLEHFTWEKITGEYEKLYLSMIGS